jgi:hypothetical protein
MMPAGTQADVLKAENAEPLTNITHFTATAGQIKQKKQLRLGDDRLNCFIRCLHL